MVELADACSSLLYSLQEKWTSSGHRLPILFVEVVRTVSEQVVGSWVIF